MHETDLSGLISYMGDQGKDRVQKLTSGVDVS